MPKAPAAEEKPAAATKRTKAKSVKAKTDTAEAPEKAVKTATPSKKKAEPEPAPTLELPVMVNGEPILLLGKPSYIFVDIFDYIEFDRSQVKGKLVVKKNGETANYFDPLQENDTLEVYWE